MNAKRRTGFYIFILVKVLLTCIFILIKVLITKLRELHAAMDCAVLDAYG